MKRIADYTDEEMVALTDEEIELTISVECMVEAIEDVPPPGPEPIFGGDLQPIKMYKINGNLLFPTPDAASQAMRLATKQSEYNSFKGIYTARAISDTDLKAESFYLAEDLAAVKKDIEGFNLIKKAWDSSNDRYKANAKEKNKIIEAVYDKLAEARRNVREAKERKEQYDKYLTLAGDATIAERFFRDLLVKKGWEAGLELEAEVARVKA